MRRDVAVAAVSLALAGSCHEASIARAQVTRVHPGLIERAMPDFSLPALDGQTGTLSQLRGRTVILVFPRGKAADEYGGDPHWCQLCHYQ